MTNLKTNIIGLSRDQIKSILVDANLIKLNEKLQIIECKYLDKERAKNLLIF